MRKHVFGGFRQGQTQPQKMVRLLKFLNLEKHKLDYMSPVFCICENKDAVTAKLISAFVFATPIVQSLYFLIPKFQASSHLLWLYSPSDLVGNPDDRFSHKEAHIISAAEHGSSESLFYHKHGFSHDAAHTILGQ